MNETATHADGGVDLGSSLIAKFGALSAVMVVTPVAVYALGDGSAGPPVAVALAGAAVEFVAAGLLYRYVVRDLYRIHDLLHAARVGDYDRPVESNRRDVVGKIYDDFAAFRDEIVAYADGVEADNRRMNEVANEYATAMRACAEGDLTRRLDDETGLPQFDTVAYQFNQMVRDLETLVADIDRFSDAIVAAESDLRADLERGESASQTIAESAVEIETAADEQSADLERAADDVEALLDSVEGVARRTEDLADTFERTTTRAADGRDAAREAIDEVETIESSVAATGDAIRRLDDLADEVGDLVERLDEVAGRANSLSNRADIEAGRSGTGDGDGAADRLRIFANELGEFTTQSRAVAREMETHLGDIGAETTAALEDVEETQARVERGTTTVEATLREFGEIAGAIERANEAADAVDRATDSQVETARSVAVRIEDVADSSDRTAALSSEVVAASKDGVDVLNGVWAAVGDLTDRARTLSDRLGRFETARHSTDSGRGGETT